MGWKQSANKSDIVEITYKTRKNNGKSMLSKIGTGEDSPWVYKKYEKVLTTP